MAPNIIDNVVFIDPEEKEKRSPGSETFDEDGVKTNKLITDPNYKHTFLPGFAIALTLLHVGGLYGFYLILTFRLKLVTFIFGVMYGFASAVGSVLGAHRGFCHNAFKLTPFGQIMLMLLQTAGGQNQLHWWIRDHRLHHKFVDTDADPYNVKRGFFFAHIGWLVMKKHPLVLEKGKTIDMSDVEANKYLMFQKKYYVPLYLLLCIIIPVAVPVLCWGEDFWIAFFTCFMYRYVHTLNCAWAINSFAHTFGAKPYDKRITATQSMLVHYVTLGDGWHNYHHVFPWHHAVNEYSFGKGFATNVLYLLNRWGIAYDLKTSSPTVVYNHSKRHGDNSLSDKELLKQAP